MSAEDLKRAAAEYAAAEHPNFEWVSVMVKPAGDTPSEMLVYVPRPNPDSRSTSGS